MAQRPGSYTTFAVMNFVVGGILLLCSVCSGIHPTVTVNNQDVTPRMVDFLNQQLPGYTAIKVTGAATGVLFAAALIAGGIGLLQASTWGRVLAIVFAILSILHHGFLIIYQLFWINPTLDRFFAGFQVFPFANISFLPKSMAIGLMIFWFLAAVYYVVQFIVLAITPPRVVEQGDWDDDRRRPRRDDYDDDDRPRRRSRREDEYDDDYDDDRPRRRRRG